MPFYLFFAANLTVSGSSTQVISSNATYDLVIVQDQASLVVKDGATLTVSGCLVGYNESSFLFDNCTVTGRINVESSAKFHLLNSTLINDEVAPTNSIFNSDNIIISSSSITATGPLAAYYTPVGDSNIELRSNNDIFIRDSALSCTGGIGRGGYYGPKPDGKGYLIIETPARIFIENNSELTATGYPGTLSLSGPGSTSVTITPSSVAGQWTLLEIDFSDISINKSDIDTILFFAAPGDDSAARTFYIDDIKLTE